MVYAHKFIAVVKWNNQILREQKQEDGEMGVSLPFGSEYSLFFKNNNTRDAVVSIEIDGKDVLDGNELVVRAGKTSSLYGFMQNRCVTNKFKFIEKTERIRNYRGDRIDDGFIVIKFAYVMPEQQPLLLGVPHYYSSQQYNIPPTVTGTPFIGGYGGASPRCSYASQPTNTPFIGSGACGGSFDMNASSATRSMSVNSNASCASLNGPRQSCKSCDSGITVPGSQTTQTFQSVSIGEIGERESLVIRLFGYNAEGQQITTPRTTKKRIICSTCGLKNSSQNKFCAECGTSLI